MVVKLIEQYIAILQNIDTDNVKLAEIRKLQGEIRKTSKLIVKELDSLYEEKAYQYEVERYKGTTDH